MTKGTTTRFEMRWPLDVIAQIDDWRRRQTPIPSRAEAVRKIIEAGLVAEGVRSADGTTDKPKDPA